SQLDGVGPLVRTPRRRVRDAREPLAPVGLGFGPSARRKPGGSTSTWGLLANGCSDPDGSGHRAHAFQLRCRRSSRPRCMLRRATGRRRWRSPVTAWWLAWTLWFTLVRPEMSWADEAHAVVEASGERKLPLLRPRPDLRAFEGRVVKEVVLVDVDEHTEQPLVLERIRLGDLLTPELVRRAMRELVENGRYASVRAEVEALADGARLRLFASIRKTVQDLRIEGGVLDPDASLRVTELAPGQEVTRPDLARVAARLW